jgi:hypothetical protein
LKVHRVNNVYYVNYFDVNGINFDKKTFFYLSVLNKILKPFTENDKGIAFEFQTGLTEYKLKYPITFHIFPTQNTVDQILSCNISGEACSELISEVPRINSYIQGGLCVLIDMFASFIWNIWTFQNPKKSYKDFLEQYNIFIIESLSEYSNAFSKFTALGVSKYQDENLFLESYCRVTDDRRISSNEANLSFFNGIPTKDTPDTPSGKLQPGESITQVGIISRSKEKQDEILDDIIKVYEERYKKKQELAKIQKKQENSVIIPIQGI